MMGVLQRLCADYNNYIIAVRNGDIVSQAKWARYMHLCWPKQLLEGLPLPAPESVGLQPQEASP